MSKQTIEYAKELVTQMTMEEKLSQMLYQSPAIERLGIPAYNWWNESLHGVARAGVSTMFPQAIAMAAMFDENMMYHVAKAIALEGRAKYSAYSSYGDRGIYKGITFWAPNINIFRDPRWGRGHETYGEDPYLTAVLGVAYVKGLQGDDRDELLSAACAKHFAVHSGPEEERHRFNAVVGKKDLFETYLYAFKRLVKDANVEAVMGAYNRVNGEPACGSKTLLKDILRDAWGFEGHVVSDCWAINDFHLHHKVTDTAAESAAMAVNNGCDLNCGNAFLHLPLAVQNGLVQEETIDAAVIRLLDTRIRLGMLEKFPSKYDSISYDVVECKDHIELSNEVARRSIVLLKNQNNILPLDTRAYKNIAVIGPNADSRAGLVGNYEGTSSEYITPLEGIRGILPENAKLLYAPGCHLFKDRTEVLAEENDRIAEAVTIAKMSDVVVMCVGLDATIEGEEGDMGNAYAAGDKADLLLPANQIKLLEEVQKVGKSIILLMSTGSAMDMKWADEHAEAVLQTWYLGARGGKAIAEILFGKVSPCGKLPITIYENIDELPDFCDYTMTNRTYRYMKNAALYPFGYGLIYSNITYELLSQNNVVTNIGEEISIKVAVTNCGKYHVWESIQAYIKDEESSVTVPNYQLKNVKSICLNAGERKEVELVLKKRDFALIDNDGVCMIEPGKFTVYISGGQPDERTIELTGKRPIEVGVLLAGEMQEVEF